MIARALMLAAGIGGAVGLSQFPEFSQQYTQRLGGAVDELARQIARTEAQAAAEGIGREAFLAALSAEGPRAEAQAQAIRSDILRHDRLAADLAALRAAGPFSRVRLATRLSDPGIARGAWQDYRPAMPATLEGGAFAATGFAVGAGLLAALLTLLRGMADVARAPFRRRRRG